MAGEFDRERELRAWVEGVRTKVSIVAESHGNLLKELQVTCTDLSSRLDFLEDATMKGFGKTWQAINEANVRLDKLIARIDARESSH